MTKEIVAIFPGSFDPLTLGHTDIVRRALATFDKVVVAVLSNPDKNTLFSVNERIELIKAEFKDCSGRVYAKSFSGLLVEFADQEKATVILRGLRAISDYDYEAQMALMNRNLSSKVETFFLMSSENCSYISSSLARQIAKFGGDVSKLVPSSVEGALKAKFRS